MADATPQTDPLLGPAPPNQQKMLPRLYKGTRKLFQRNHHLDGTIPTYWGPSQDAPAGDGTYFPPGNWPRAGTLLRVPRVARWFWEAADVQTEVWIAAGYAGAYSFGQHTLTNDFDVTTPGGILPEHQHGSSLDQHGIEAYGTPVHTKSTGHLDLYNGPVDANGAGLWWLYADYLPPIILEEYENRKSDTYKAVAMLWSILAEGGDGDTGPPAPVTTVGIPPITITSDAPVGVGITYPIKTGVFFLNGIAYGERSDPHKIGLTIPVGWKQPPPLKTTGNSSSNWAELNKELNAEYKGSTNPYFNAYPVQNMEDFLDIVTPAKDGFFATHCVNFITLSTPHPFPSPDDPRIKRIKEVYPHMATYVVVILLDRENLSEQQGAGDFVVPTYIAAIEAIVGTLKDFGWFLESVSFITPSTTAEIIDRYIKTYLKPELNDAPPPDTES